MIVSVITESATPRESSTDAGNDKENVQKSDNVEENQEKIIPIVTTITENVQMVEERQLEVGDHADNEGAVGGIIDDAVFLDENAAASTSKAALIQSSPHRSSCDNDEEVDDIELILSSDDKEFPQEDLVSISYYEPWQMCGQSGTPILVNFNTISSDNECADGMQEKLSASPSPIDPDQFYNAIKENVAQQQLSLESTDSLSLGDNLKHSYDFNIKSSSLERDPKITDENGLIRDESFDTFEQVGVIWRVCLYKFHSDFDFFSFSQDMLRRWVDVGQITMFSKKRTSRRLVSLKKVCPTKEDAIHAQIQAHTDQLFIAKQSVGFCIITITIAVVLVRR